MGCPFTNGFKPLLTKTDISVIHDSDTAIEFVFFEILILHLSHVLTNHRTVCFVRNINCVIHTNILIFPFCVSTLLI